MKLVVSRPTIVQFRADQQQSFINSTEKAISRWSIDQIERDPLDNVRRLIQRALIDVPSDIDQWCTVANTIWIQRHLGGWIDILILDIRWTHRRNDTTTGMRVNWNRCSTKEKTWTLLPHCNHLRFCIFYFHQSEASRLKRWIATVDHQNKKLISAIGL